MILYGGIYFPPNNYIGVVLGDMWAFNYTTKTWRLLLAQNEQLPRFAHAAVTIAGTIIFNPLDKYLLSLVSM